MKEQTKVTIKPGDSFTMPRGSHGHNDDYLYHNRPGKPVMVYQRALHWEAQTATPTGEVVVPNDAAVEWCNRHGVAVEIEGGAK